jgi:phage portal protein BeeE
VVFGIINARLRLFSDASFKFRSLADKGLFGTPALGLLEEPWPNGTTGDLLARMLQDVDLAGNAFVRRVGDRLYRLLPDRVLIITGERESGLREVTGYAYYEQGLFAGEPLMLDVDEVAHWSPLPDPLADWRGMSWLTPVLREIDADLTMSSHLQTFFTNAATPNLIVRYAQKVNRDQLDTLAAQLQARHGGSGNAFKTMILDGGADVTVAGHSFREMAVEALRGRGEVRLCVAAGIPPIVANVAAGLDASTYSNYSQAWKAFAAGTMHQLWRSVCASLGKFVDVPAGSELWFDLRDIPAMAESEQDKQNANVAFATAAASFVMQGWDPASVQAALVASDMSLLQHTGALSVQLYPGGQGEPAEDTPEDDTEDQAEQPEPEQETP